ncbi:hypothetical protein [Tepidiforma sp.]|uniref:hypothetical protein n=1 Tax=Tepidiforma sp. TaxID=2682230 RepID=UPI002ADD5948|nr:hypothetical protein [Tepidiforma sp.]
MNQPTDSAGNVHPANPTMRIGGRDFWKPLRLAELAAEQGAGPVFDVAALAQPAWADVDDIEEDLRALRTGD